MRDWLTTIGELAGAAIACYGVFLYSEKIGFIVFGLAMTLFSWLAAQ